MLTAALKSLAATSVIGISPEPYFRIVDRNAFGLQPLNLKLPEVRLVAPAHRDLSLIGITTILDRKRAILAVSGGEKHGSKEWLLLAECQMQDGIGLKKIDENAETAEISNGDETKILKLAHEYSTPPVPPPVIEMTPAKVDLDAPPPLTPEQTALLIEAERMKYQQDGDPTAKILPPTDLTDELRDIELQPDSN